MLTFFFFNDTATTEIYTLSLHDALPIFRQPLLQLHQMALWLKDDCGSRCGLLRHSRHHRQVLLHHSLAQQLHACPLLAANANIFWRTCTSSAPTTEPLPHPFQFHLPFSLVPVRGIQALAW